MQKEFFKKCNISKTNTKILATLGPATNTKEKIEELVKAGATIFRLNTSHGKLSEHKQLIESIRIVENKLKVILTIIVDLQGPKIRIGNLEKDIELLEGKTYQFKYLSLIHI